MANEPLLGSLRRKFVRLRRILAFLVLASEDRCLVSTLFSNTHILFENELDKRREYAAVNRDFEWWWRVRNTAKDFIKKFVANGDLQPSG
ncbi:MAG: hypothetical protein HC846_00240 [Blastocatellia bacterium]|nr:hypothetical protein [Blastocatellia bacterium]